jgi:hypothetical protein
MPVRFGPRVKDALEQYLHRTQPSVLSGPTSPGVKPSWGSPFKTRERRRDTRFVHSFPARVWGVDVNDEAFGLDCLIDDISPSGLFLKMPRQINSLSEISLAVRLLSDPKDGATAAIKGKVIRDEPEADGKRGIAVKITQYCFL